MFRTLRLPALAILAILAVACGDPAGPTGSKTGLGGLVTYEPPYAGRAPRAAFRSASVSSPSDTRPIPGTMFWFDPGPIEREHPGGHSGTLIVHYDRLTLPAGVTPEELIPAYWHDGEWNRVYAPYVDRAAMTIRFDALSGGSTYALLGPNGMSIAVALGEHYAGYHSGDSLLVHAWVHSDEEIASVTAHYADRQAGLPLEYSTWKGWVKVAGVPPGPHVLRATARTISGREISDTITILRNIPPKITVTSPLDFSVANPTLRIQATCTDEAPGGCRSLTARVSYPDGEPVEVAAGTSAIDKEISLAGGVGEMQLTIAGTDAAGQTVSHRSTVYAADAANVSVAVRASGRVLDYDGTRVLYADSVVERRELGAGSAGSGRVRLGSGNASADPVLHRGGLPDWGTILAPDHALFTVWRNRLTWSPLKWTLVYPDADSLYEWRGGAATLLSAASYSRQLAVENGITAWQDGVRSYDNPPKVTTIRMRDLATGATATLSTTATAAPVDVGAGRTVTWGEPTTRIVVWQDGAVRFTSEDGWNSSSTDGVNTVLRGYYATDLLVPTGRSTIASASGIQVSSVAAHGYVAFTRPSGGNLQVWLRTPTGTEHQLTHFGTGVADVFVRDVTPSGTVIYTTGRAQYPAVLRQYAVRAGQSPRYLGAGAGRVVELNGQLHLLIGNVVFQVN